MTAQSPDLLARAHELLNAPHLFGARSASIVPAFLIALVITAILAVGIKESARFNSTIVVIKVAVVLFVIGLGFKYVNCGNWGHDWSSFAPTGFAGIGAAAAYIFFAYIGFDAVSTTAQEAKNPQRDLPIGIMLSLLICTVLYIAVAGVLTGMVPWREVNIEAPVARAFLDRGLTGASHIITLGALAGLTSVMLVMLLGQTRVLYSMANDGSVAQEILCGRPSQVAHAVEEHDSRGISCRHRGQRDADRRHRQNGQYRNAAGVRDRVYCGDGAAQDESRPAAAVPDSVGARGASSGHSLQRLHDVQAGLDQLGAVGHLAGHWNVRLLRLQREAQQGAGAGNFQALKRIVDQGLSRRRGRPFCFRVSRWRFVFGRWPNHSGAKARFRLWLWRHA